MTSERLIRNKRKRRLVYLGIFTGCTAIFVAILFFVFRSPYLRIQEVIVLGNEIVDDKMVKEITEGMLDENYFFVFPKDNKLIYPKEEIESRIRKEIGRIETITLKVEKNVLYIKIGERGSYAIWCSEAKDCYYLDSNGLIFSEAPAFSSGVYKVFKGVVLDEEPIGKKFLDSAKLQSVMLITDYLKSQGWNTEEINVSTLRDVEFIQDNGPKVKVDLTKSSDETVKVLKTLISSKEFQDVAKNMKSIEYIDARFGSKIFFKQKNSPLPASAASAL